jgi:hypothetical protein
VELRACGGPELFSLIALVRLPQVEREADEADQHRSRRSVVEVFGSDRGCPRGLLNLPRADQLPGARVPKQHVRPVHEGCEILVAVTPRSEKNDGQVEAGEVLLVRDPFVRRHEDIELLLCQLEQLAVLLAAPATLGATVRT